MQAYKPRKRCERRRDPFVIGGECNGGANAEGQPKPMPSLRVLEQAHRKRGAKSTLLLRRQQPPRPVRASPSSCQTIPKRGQHKNERRSGFGLGMRQLEARGRKSLQSNNATTNQSSVAGFTTTVQDARPPRDDISGCGLSNFPIQGKGFLTASASVASAT